MKYIDIRLKPEEVSILKSLTGKTLNSYKHDAFTFTPSSSQAISIIMENDVAYYLYSFTEPLDYFGTQEDIAVWSFRSDKYPMIDRKTFVNTPVGETIQNIILIQENQRMYSNGEQIYDVWLTRGIVIDFGDHQIAFEKAIWFSEEIIVHKGYDLPSKFEPTETFGKNWDNSVRTECSREYIVL